MSSFRSGTHSERWVCVVAVRGLAFVEKVPLLRNLKNVWKQLTQGLRPGLCRSIAPLGLFYDKSKISVSVSYSFRLIRRTYLSNLTKHFEPIAFRRLYDTKLHHAQ